jgi:hypothetical protein
VLTSQPQGQLQIEYRKEKIEITKSGQFIKCNNNNNNNNNNSITTNLSFRSKKSKISALAINIISI